MRAAHNVKQTETFGLLHHIRIFDANGRGDHSQPLPTTHYVFVLKRIFVSLQYCWKSAANQVHGLVIALMNLFRLN